MTDHQRSDVQALLDAFAPEQLAMFMARRLLADGQQHTLRADFFEVETPVYPALIVAPVRPRWGGEPAPASEADGYTVTVREKTRATGYYIVFEANYGLDVVAFWNDETGRWQATHLENTEMLASSNYTNPRALKYPAPQIEEETHD